MGRQRTGKASTAQRCISQLLAALGKYLPRRGLPLICQDARIRWTDRMQVILAILMGWLPSPTQQEAFEAGREVLIEMYDSRRRPGKCLKGFLKALAGRSGRLLRVRDGRKQMSLLTNVLDGSLLSDRDVAALYRRRWIVEVQYRSLKQTMRRRKMLSTTPDNARVELDWAVVGLWMLELMVAEAVPRRDRHRWSVAEALKVLRRMIRGRQRPPAGGLQGQLRKAVIDRYTRRRPKSARNWPHKKRERPPGQPRIRTASRSEVLLAQKRKVQKMVA